MAELKIAIPNDKVQLVLDAYADVRGIDPTASALKAEFISEIKQTVKRYKLKMIASGQETSVSQSDMQVDIG